MSILYDGKGNIIDIDDGNNGDTPVVTPSTLEQSNITRVLWYQIKSSPQICFVFDLDGIENITSEVISFDAYVDDSTLKSFNCNLCHMDTYSTTSVGSLVENKSANPATGKEKFHFEYSYKTLTSKRYAIIWMAFASNDTFTLPFGVKFFDLSFIVNGEKVPLYNYYIMSAYSDGSAMHSIEYVPSSLFVSQDDIKKVSTNNPWYDKKWMAFGTSITDIGAGTGKYVPYLAQYNEMFCSECGNGGGQITGGGTIYNNIMGRESYAGYDLITIEGFVNDWYGNKDIGTVGDTENSTFCGALYLLLKHLQETSTARIVVITDHHTRATSTYPSWGVFAKNSGGKTQADFWEATKNVCKMVGVPVIDAGEGSGISPLVETHYVDQIHHSDIGGEVYAKYIWDKLKNIPPMV